MIAKSSESQTEHSDSVLRGERSPGHIFIATGDVSACLYVTSGSQSNNIYHREQKKTQRRASVMQEVKISPSPVFVVHETLSTEEESGVEATAFEATRTGFLRSTLCRVPLHSHTERASMLDPERTRCP